MKKITIGTAVFLMLAAVSMKAYSHCQIPCGIYDDQLRIQQIKEHITTIEKSMKMITDLSKEDEKNYNQIVRWVMNKEEHADKLTEIVTYYFMAQRIKPIADKESEEYKEMVQKLTLLHEIMVYTMKAKQTVDLTNIGKLTELTDKFSEAYFKEHGHKH